MPVALGRRPLVGDIAAFIEEKWKHSERELCDTDQWMVYPEPKTHAYLPVGDERNPPQIPQPMVPYVALSCVNCGNLRLIDARTFEKWRRERDPKAEE